MHDMTNEEWVESALSVPLSEPAPKMAALAMKLDDADAASVELTERGFSRLFAKCMDGVVAWVPEERAYRRFDGRVWSKDGDSQLVMKDAKLFSDALLVYGASLPDGKGKTDFVQYASRYSKLNARRTLVEDAKCELVVHKAEFDSRPELLNLLNGMLDTDSFDFMPHDPAAMQTRLAPVKFDPEAACDEWASFIDGALLGDAGTIAYLQKQFGVALTCDTSQECMFILYGKTRSGKSTAVETMAAVLGRGETGYARTAQPETLAAKEKKDGSRPSGDVARLAGARLVVTPEPDKSMLFDVAKVKQMLGRDAITARFINERDFEFVPVYSLFMNTNYLPRVNDQTLFESDRVAVIPFNRHLGPQERDTGLKDRLTRPESLSGVLNWCLDGLRAYKAEGAERPAAVIAATEEYARSSDKLMLFFDERMEPFDGDSRARDAYGAYEAWCKESGLRAEGLQSFFQGLRDHGLFKDRAAVGGKRVKGVVVGFRVKRESILPNE